MKTKKNWYVIGLCGLPTVIMVCYCVRTEHSVNRGIRKSAFASEALPSRQSSVALYNATLNRYNKFLSKRRFERQINSPKQLLFSEKYDGNYRRKVAVLRGSSDSLEMRFLGEPANVVFFFDGSNPRYKESAPSYETPPLPTWTQEKAVLIGRQVLTVVCEKDVLENTTLSVAEYQPGSIEESKHYSGSWYIGWMRTDSKGHEFLNDGITVQMSEQYGPFVVGITLPSIFEEKDFVPIAENTAIDKSKDYVVKIMNWAPASERFEGYALTGEVTTSLKIVNPNHILQFKSIEELGSLGDLNAKLAWVVIRKAKYRGPRLETGGTPVDAEIHVWIDAENSEFLGGDFK